MSRDPRPAGGSKPRRAQPPHTPAGEARGAAGASGRAGGPHRPGASTPGPGPASVPAQRGPRNAALAAVLAAALGLRLWNLGHGLPDFLDEALPFRWALAMWGDPGAGIDWNPHRFHHPSLATYLHLFVQLAGYMTGRLLGGYRNPADYHVSFLVDPTSMALAARAVGIVADLATVVLVARIGERLRPGAGWLAALVVACSPTFVVAARSICSDSVMVALAVAAVERMLAYRARGGTARLVAVAALIGLAAGAKYPAALLLGPLALALWLRGGVRALGLWPLAAAIAGAVFLATTPFAVLDLPTFRRDLGFVRGLAQQGHLGNLADIGFLYHLRNLSRNVSWAGVLLLAASLAWTARRFAARPDASLLWLSLLVFGVPIAFARVEAERYLLPVLALAAVLIAEATLAAADRIPGRWRRAALAAAALLCVGPATAASVWAVASSEDGTRIEARRWCETHLGQSDILVQEHYAAPLLGRMEWLNTRSGPQYAGASPEVRRRYDALRWYFATTIPLSVVGAGSNRVHPPSGPPVDLEVFPHASDFTQAAYDPRLFQGADYFATTRSVRGRFEADRVRYAAQNRIYALLDSTAEVVARFGPHGRSGGPEIVYYRLGDRAQRALEAFGPLDTLWWAEMIPRSYRERAQSLLRPEGPGTSEVRLPDGSPAAWVLSLRPVYQYLLANFAVTMGMELVDRGRYAAARRFGSATLVVAPEDLQACILYVVCSAHLGEWGAARWALERSLRALQAVGETSPILRLHYGEVLLNLGDRGGARREFEAVAAGGGEVGADARLWLERMR